MLRGVEVSPKDFQKDVFGSWGNKFDQSKLKNQLVYFLRFIIQLCIVEVSFLKNTQNTSKYLQNKNYYEDPDHKKFAD